LPLFCVYRGIVVGGDLHHSIESHSVLVYDEADHVIRFVEVRETVSILPCCDKLLGKSPRLFVDVHNVLQDPEDIASALQTQLLDELEKTGFETHEFLGTQEAEPGAAEGKGEVELMTGRKLATVCVWVTHEGIAPLLARAQEEGHFVGGFLVFLVGDCLGLE
jgi:hypothetical protein